MGMGSRCGVSHHWSGEWGAGGRCGNTLGAGGSVQMEPCEAPPIGVATRLHTLRAMLGVGPVRLGALALLFPLVLAFALALSA